MGSTRSRLSITTTTFRFVCSSSASFTKTLKYFSNSIDSRAFCQTTRCYCCFCFPAGYFPSSAYCSVWWAVLDLNQWPLACEASALTTELTAHARRYFTSNSQLCKIGGGGISFYAEGQEQSPQEFLPWPQRVYPLLQWLLRCAECRCQASLKRTGQLFPAEQDSGADGDYLGIYVYPVHLSNSLFFS